MSDHPTHSMYRRDFLEKLGALSLGAFAAAGPSMPVQAAGSLGAAPKEMQR